MNYSILKSRTVWTVFAMFLVGGIQAVSALLPTEGQTLVLAVLSIVAGYFHVNPSQDYK